MVLLLHKLFFLLICLLFLCPLQSEAVKDYLFKKCDQSGFCNRNRHFAQEVIKKGSDYESRYSIDISSLVIEDDAGFVIAKLLKRLNDGSHVDLSLRVSVLTDNNLRLQVDEINRGTEQTIIKPQRYNEAGKWAFVQEPELIPFTHYLTTDDLTLNWGDSYETKIDLYPFKLTLSYKGTPTLVINDRNLLNLEHYRSKSDENTENSIHIAPEESTFNAYSDNFKDSKNDKLPLGPESVALDFTFLDTLNVFGVPEHADSLSLKDTTEEEPYRLFNVDIFEYSTQSRYPMYGSIPLMLSVNADYSSGVFWINSADTYIDIKKVQETEIDEKKIEQKAEPNKVQTHWMSETGLLDVILFVKDSPNEISLSYGALTGFPALPNLFSLGYHQSRWNYNDEQDVLDVTAKFDENLIPFDTLWLDIEYTDEKKYFTWDPKAFPNPDRMLRKLDETGRSLVAIIDPHIKKGYDVSQSIEKLGIGIKNSDNKDTFHGHCWPGESVWVDTLNPESQEFWNKQYANGSRFMGQSTNLHLWNDMNEPSVFNGPETSAPKDLIHYGDWEHRSVHNLYGLTLHEATYNSLLARNPNLRPFILTRSFYSGSQRTAAMWTGDNMAKWEYLRESIPMVLTLNIVGFQFSGADIAGFFGNPDNELMVRWYQAGIFYPFFRGHAHIDSRRHEPYVAGGEYTDIMRDTIKLRYKLLPLLYTEFYKSSVNGSPIMTPLFYFYPENKETYEIDDQFFFGKSLLVKPATQPGQKELYIYLPDGETYYDFNDFTSYKGKGYHNFATPLDKVPMLIKSGSIIPTKQRYRRSSKLMKFDPYTLYLTVDSNNEAEGELYIDDGETFNAMNDGDFIHLRFTFKDGKLTSKLIEGNNTKSFTSQLSKVKVERIIVVGYDKLPESVEVEQGGKTWGAEILKDEKSFTIRNPAVGINDEWTINVV